MHRNITGNVVRGDAIINPEDPMTKTQLFKHISEWGQYPYRATILTANISTTKNITSTDTCFILTGLITVAQKIDCYHDQWDSNNTDTADGSSLGAVSYDTK